MNQTKVVELDQVEMAVRLIEAMLELPRPSGFTAAEALAAFEAMRPGTMDSVMRAARAAFMYVTAQIVASGAGGTLIPPCQNKTVQ